MQRLPSPSNSIRIMRVSYFRPSKFCEIVAILSAFLVCSVVSRADEHRDWKKYPAIIECAIPTDLYALGDVHGDYERMIELLTAGKLIADSPANPADAKWTGGKAILIVTGDFIDKYNHSVEVISFFRTMQRRAEAACGRVIVALGNHEAEFLASGGEGKKSAMFRKELEAAGLSAVDVAAGRDANGIGEWLRGLPVAVKVGDWFFCHAGNAAGRSMAQLEGDVEEGISSHGYAAPILSSANSILQARMHPRQFWDATGDVQIKEVDPQTTDLQEKSNESEKRLRAMVEALGCRHLVIGHQPGKITFADGSVREAGKIIAKFGGLFFMIDTGMSRGANSGSGALLKIHLETDHFTAGAIHTDGKVVPVFP